MKDVDVTAMPLPHTEEWFKKMKRINPGQARHTKGIIATSDSLDVCGICGDPNDLSERAALTDDGAVIITARICSDCERIQRDSYGTVLAPTTRKRRD